MNTHTVAEETGAPERVLSDAEVSKALSTPYAFLQPVIRRRYFVAAAGGATWPGWISSRGGWS